MAQHSGQHDDTIALAEQFRLVLRSAAAGVAIVATNGPSGRGALTVSSFCSLSFEPPSILVCLRQSGSTLRQILDNGLFTINILAEDQSDLALAFAVADKTPEQRFAHGRWRLPKTGCPVLEGALAHVECRLAKTHDYGTHKIVIGDVCEAVSYAARPLVYAEQGFHRLPSAKKEL